MNADRRRELLGVFSAALAAVNGRERVRRRLAANPLAGPVALIAIGKAACAMAQGAHQALGERIAAAFVVTKHGYAEPLPWPVRAAGHPLPDEQSLKAGAELTDFIAGIPGEHEVLLLLSGGASSLVERLPPGITLTDLQAVTRWLLASGLDIARCNRVRKRLSMLKGGRLAMALAPRIVTCLVLSDVPGDVPSVIGSGPVSPEPDDAGGADDDLPDFIKRLMRHESFAPPAGAPCFMNISYEILATLEDAKCAAAEHAETLGYRVQVHDQFVSGDAIAAGKVLAKQLLASAPGTLHVWGGETTLRLPDERGKTAPAFSALPPSMAGAGRGGRNQSLALAAALALQGEAGVMLLAAGTDGSDGPTPDAGALVDGETIARGALAGLDADLALARADAGNYLEQSGDLVHTGPTGTNVMDIMLGLRY
jgi:hydroxypyruvate reductase